MAKLPTFYAIGEGLCYFGASSHYPPYGRFTGSLSEVKTRCEGQADCLAYAHYSGSIGSSSAVWELYCSARGGVCDNDGNAAAVTVRGRA